MSKPVILKEVTMALSLEPDMELQACQKACALAEFMNMSPDKIDEVQMAVIEAVINAIEHSHAPDGRIFVHIAVLGHEEPEKLQITVQDRGVGFQRGKLLKPTIEEKLKVPNKRGWGLEIIEGLMDTVDIRSGEDGTRVIMSKAR